MTVPYTIFNPTSQNWREREEHLPVNILIELEDISRWDGLEVGCGGIYTKTSESGLGLGSGCRLAIPRGIVGRDVGSSNFDPGVQSVG